MSLPAKPYKRAFVTTLEAHLKEHAPLIQVILGPRQVGKTTGVHLLSKKVYATHYASADDIFNPTPEWIAEQWQTAKMSGPNPILIIDEVQKILHWSEKIKSLWDAEKHKRGDLRVVLLGSSSLNLQRGLEESLTGRFEVIPAPHWGFIESKEHLDLSLEEYLLLGGYPEATRFKGDFPRWRSYLKNSIIETVVGKDLLRLSTVRKPALFRQLFDILSAHPAQEVSYNNLLGQLQDRGNTDLVKHYIEIYEAAYLFKSIPKYSGSVVRQRASTPKIFPLCPALSTHHLEKRELRDPVIRGHLFEAIVGAELAKLDGKLFYWKGKAELDFVYMQGRDVFAIEVKSGRKKSAKGMTEFLTHYPKAKPVFITWDRFEYFAKNSQQFIENAAS